MYNPRVTKDFDTFRMFLKSEDIVLSDDGNLRSTEGKNFEILKQTIGLRAIPESVSALKKVRSVKDLGSENFKGTGYVWDFAIEAVDIFLGDDGNPVGLLQDELNDTVLPCGNVLKTSGDDLNLEFLKGDFDVDSGDIE